MRAFECRPRPAAAAPRHGCTCSLARRTPPSCRFGGDRERPRLEGVALGPAADKLPPEAHPRYLLPESDLLGAAPWDDLVDADADADAPESESLDSPRPPRSWRSLSPRGVPLDPRGGLLPPPGGRSPAWLPWWATVVAICAVAWRLANRGWVYQPAARPPLAATATSARGWAHQTVLGHRRVEEAPAADLTRVRDARGLTAERLRSAAATAFESMVTRAKADGVAILAVSGFRSVEAQQHVFFGVKADRLQTASQRAKVSAPPGYSEHHTGYAMDVGTPGARPLEEEFERTEAFRWLAANAAKFHYELSFPRGNAAGIAYEPWHWRFVGSTHALETFH